MQLSAHQQATPAENPFSQVKPSFFVRQRARSAGVNVRWMPPVCEVGAVENRSSRGPGLLKSAAIGLAGRGVLVLTLFALLPLPWQQAVFQSLGWGRFHTPRPSVQVPLPVEYSSVSSPFGQRWGRLHQGIDLAARAGQPIYAISDGTVTHSGWESGYGYSVVLDHGSGLQTRYAHCATVLVTAGNRVVKGQAIARVGSSGHSTGPHLHFEVLVNGLRKNPARYYPFKESPQRYLLTARPE